WYWRYGVSPETSYIGDDSVIGALSSPDVWTTDHRGDGISSMYVLCNAPDEEHFSKRFPNGAPTPSVVAQTYKVFDSRDGTQDHTDESTFQFSENIALQIAHLLCFNPFTADYNFEAAILSIIDKWEEEAD